MQSVVRASASLATPSAGTMAARRHSSMVASTSGRVVHQHAAEAAAVHAAVPACMPARTRCLSRRHALKNEEAELERITREAGQADIWDNEIVGTALKVALVAGVVAVAVFIGRLGEPMVENTIKSFPTPAEYEAYEESR